MKPLIGAAPLVDPERESLWMLPGYFNLIKECGGSPIMIDPVFDEDVASRLDGILITGGQDVYALLDYALAHRIPVFGICRGIQIINVYFGGTLTDDLPSERPGIEHHQAHPYDLPTHPVKLFGKLKELLGTDHLEVNTLHHQAADRLGKGLVLEAEAPRPRLSPGQILSSTSAPFSGTRRRSGSIRRRSSFSSGTSSGPRGRGRPGGRTDTAPQKN